ncbi:uncharacterized protein TNCV_58021 [Trichonephila clavipes]|nr:uncharacterized protein TNCV_58021 [Trichonephila clavipes]
MENVAEFLENIDNNLTYYEIPTQLACAYLKGHLTGRALDWFEVLGSRGPQSIAGPLHQLDTRQCKPPTEESRQGAKVQYDRARETRTTPSKGNSAAERRPVQSRQATTVRPCPYYLRSRLKKPEGIPEEHWDR